MNHSTLSPQEIPQGHKRCSKGVECIHPDGPILPVSEFYRNGSKLRSDCKRCFNQAMHERYLLDPEPKKARERARSKRLWAENPERERENSRQKRLSNVEKYRASGRRSSANYYAKPEKAAKAKAQHRQWVKDHPEKAKEYKARRRAAKLAAGGSFTARDIEQLYELQKGLCWWCSCELNGSYHADHRVPLARQGSNDIANIVLTCKRCNQSKHDKLPGEWNGRLL